MVNIFDEFLGVAGVKSVDGPAQRWFEVYDQNDVLIDRYEYIKLLIKAFDKPHALAYFLCGLANHLYADAILVWRVRPEVEEIDGGFQVRARFALVPDFDKFEWEERGGVTILRVRDELPDSLKDPEEVLKRGRELLENPLWLQDPPPENAEVWKDEKEKEIERP